MPDPYKGQREVVGLIYLIHFSRPFHHASHYVGWTGKQTIDERLASHRRGCGSRLVRAALQAGIELEVVRVWRGTRNDERAIKRRKSTPRLCPCCYERPTTIKLEEVFP